MEGGYGAGWKGTVEGRGVVGGGKSREEVEGVGRVLNLKVKPPPLLPNPRAEREGCLASSSHSTDLNGSRAPLA